MRPAGILLKYDGLTASGADAYEERVRIYCRDDMRCQCGCERRVAFDDFELAHKIANTKANRARWGDWAIDNPLNRVVALREHNSRVNIGGRPAECAELISRMKGGI